jgi:hypothetical protein
MSRALTALVFVLWTAVPGLSEDQTAIERPPEVDPYTGGDQELMAKVGIVSFGPFPWAENQTTLTIEELLGGIPILWAETAHFRIGSSLSEYKLGGDRAERKLLKKELASLRDLLPEVPKRATTLDPWLRLHLYAQRLERLYADFQEELGLADADFIDNRAMGRGPYLGQPEKYTVLLFQRSSSWSRYAREVLGQDGKVPHRYNFTQRGSLFYGTCKEFYYGSYDHDLALYCGVVFGVAQNLVDGLRFYGHETPLWLSVGTGHWFSREVDERWVSSVGEPGAVRLDPDDSNWEPKVRALVGNEYFVETSELFDWRTASEMKMIDNRFAWSRVDYLLRGPDEASGFYAAFSKSIPNKLGPPDWSLVRKREDEALTAIGLDAAGFDEAWRKWVMKEYRKR